MHSWVGTGLLTADADKWRRNRKMLTASFHSKVLEQFVPLIIRNAKILVRKLDAESMKNDGLIKDLSQFLLLCTLDVICETIMGTRIDAQSNPDGVYIRAVQQMSVLTIRRSLNPLVFLDCIYNVTPEGREQRQALKILHGFTDSVIKARKEIIKSVIKKENSKNNFMDTLIREHLADPKAFTEVNIREEVDTFMFGGHDTTAWAVIWSTYLLGLHPKCQAKVHEEVDALFADKETDDLTLEEIRAGLNYTEAVVKESQRLCCSVPIFSRIALKNIEIKGKSVPAGTNFLIAPSLVHHDGKYWPEAMRFKPERFLDRQQRHPFSFIPFSAGPRNCIGQKFALLETKALIAYIFRNFKVTSLDHRDAVVTSASLVLKSNIPIRVRLESRFNQ